MKKMTLDDLKAFRDSLRIPITDEQLEADPYQPPYYHPGADSDVIKYSIDRRAKLGGTLPSRRVDFEPLKLPGDEAYAQVKKGSGKQEVATTMAFVRLLKDLLRDKEFGPRIVPIIPDEARTFGMDAFFPTIKIYNPNGQNYTPVDAELMLAYRESASGQILHLGINEAGSLAAFTAAGTSYATHGKPMIPIYVFYSMFGFQRTGDSIWAAADQMTPRLPHRRHGRSHDADRRGPPARRRPQPAARGDQPGGRALRPGLRLRDRPHHAGRAAPDVRRGHDARRGQRHLLPHRLQRAAPAADGARGRRRRGHPARHAPDLRGRHRGLDHTPRARSCSARASACRGRSRPSSCSPTTGAWPPTSGR